jgi:hypothetical protein
MEEGGEPLRRETGLTSIGFLGKKTGEKSGKV